MAPLLSRSVARPRGHRAKRAMVYTISLGKQGKRVYAIEASDLEKERKGGFPWWWWCILFPSLSFQGLAQGLPEQGLLPFPPTSHLRFSGIICVALFLATGGAIWTGQAIHVRMEPPSHPLLVSSYAPPSLTTVLALSAYFQRHERKEKGGAGLLASA